MPQEWWQPAKITCPVQKCQENRRFGGVGCGGKYLIALIISLFAVFKGLVAVLSRGIEVDGEGGKVISLFVPDGRGSFVTLTTTGYRWCQLHPLLAAASCFMSQAPSPHKRTPRARLPLFERTPS